MAPEVIRGAAYDSKVDIWSLGVLAYCLLSGGKFPFDDRDSKKLEQKIKVMQPDYSFVSKYENAAELRDFLMRCLERDP